MSLISLALHLARSSAKDKSLLGECAMLEFINPLTTHQAMQLSLADQLISVPFINFPQDERNIHSGEDTTPVSTSSSKRCQTKVATQLPETLFWR